MAKKPTKKTVAKTGIRGWIKNRVKERTSWDGGVCIAMGMLVLFMAPLAKIAAGLAIAWGVWTIWKSE